MCPPVSRILICGLRDHVSCQCAAGKHPKHRDALPLIGSRWHIPLQRIRHLSQVILPSSTFSTHFHTSKGQGSACHVLHIPRVCQKVCVRLTLLVAQLLIRVQPLGPACTVHGAVIRPIPNMCWHINVVEWWVHIVGTALLQSYIQTLPLSSLLLI